MGTSTRSGSTPRGKAALEPTITKEVPTLKTFEQRFIEGYARANRQKASTVATKQRVMRLHLLPSLGHKRLDAITNEDIQVLKASLAVMNAKTVNNVLNVLSKLLHVAVDWGVIDRMPCTIKLLRVVTPVMDFYESDQRGRLVEAATKLDHRMLVMVLLGCDAGLRRGEIISLRQSDVDLRRKQIHIERSSWNTIEDVPKGGRGRIVPMTVALVDALTRNRHLRGDRVLHQDDGTPVDENLLQDWMRASDATRGPQAHALTSRAASHVLLAARHEGSTREGDPRARRSPVARHDAEVHAPLAVSARGSHSAPRRRISWRHCGDGQPQIRKHMKSAWLSARA